MGTPFLIEETPAVKVRFPRSFERSPTHNPAYCPSEYPDNVGVISATARTVCIGAHTREIGDWLASALDAVTSKYWIAFAVSNRHVITRHIRFSGIAKLPIRPGPSAGFAAEPASNSASSTHFPKPPVSTRSEEHTSELQSRPHLVCRLLLEKTKPAMNTYL